MRENGSGSNGRRIKRGDKRGEDIRLETLEAVFNHAVPKPTSETNVTLNKLARWCNPTPERIESQ